MDNSYGSDADTGTVGRGIPWRNDGVPQWNLREEASLLTFTLPVSALAGVRALYSVRGHWNFPFFGACGDRNPELGHFSTLGQLPHENKTAALFTTSGYESTLQSTIALKGT